MIPQQQEISAQVWICHDCGGHDPKSCGCAGATAYSELAAKREQDRVRAKAYRQRRAAASRDAPVEKIDEIPSEAGAHESWQADVYDQACHLVERMDGETRQRFFAHLRREHGVAIVKVPEAATVPEGAQLSPKEAGRLAVREFRALRAGTALPPK